MYIPSSQNYCQAMVTLYNTKIEIELEPVGNPTVSIISGDYKELVSISKPICYTFKHHTPETTIKIIIELLDKSDNDPDTAVIIKTIRLNNISNVKFAYAGTYYPIYPVEWSKEQLDLKPSLPGQTYLGWNGVYELEITVPIFTWMHRTMGLGWIFE